MAISTLVHIYTTDSQGYTERVSINVTPATFGATTMPTAAHIEALVAALFGDFTVPTDGPSTSKVMAYSAEVIQDAPPNPGSQDGIVATSIALKARSGIGAAGRTGRFGLEGIELRIPGFNKGIVTFNPQDRNQVTMTTSLFDSVRTALVALGYRDPLTGFVFSAPDTLESGVVFNGKRQPMRPR